MPRLTRERIPVVAALAVGLVGCLGYLGAEMFFLAGGLGFPLDDSWIHLQFARNLSTGDGLTYNPGEPVAGSTAPLWTALLSILFLLPGSVLLWVKLAGIVVTVGALHAVYVLARELGLAEGLAAFATLLTAMTSWILWSAVSGMEIPVFLLLSLWGIILHLRERRRSVPSAWGFTVLALSALARPEGALLVAMAVVDRMLLWKRAASGDLSVEPGQWQALIKGALTALILITPILVLNWTFSESLLPTTFGAKSGGLKRLLPDLRYLYEVISVFMRTQPYMLFLSVAGVLVLIERLGTERDRGLLPGLWLTSLPIAYSMITPSSKHLLGNYGRYYHPLFPILITLGVLALSRAAHSIGPRVVLGRLRVPLRGAIMVVILLPTVSSAILGAGQYLQSVGNIEDGDVQMAKWLAERVDPRAVIAVNDVGALKYFLPNQVIDLAGIIHPRAKAYIDEARASGRDWREGVVRLLEETRPDYLAIFPSWYPGLERLNTGFAPLYELEVPANIALGGDRIVVYKTPWTRFPLGAGSETR
ncbi:MAG: hypothetical protein ACE5GX_07210 [Thermoanaerobaculia bacterium]